MKKKKGLKKKEFKLENYFKKYSYDVNRVVGLDPFDFNDVFILENGVLGKMDFKDIKKEHLLATYIPTRNVITHEIRVAKNLLQKIDLDTYVETKAFEEVGLDDVEEYIFRYKSVDVGEEKEVIIEIVIMERGAIEEYFAPIIEKFDYLDFVSYSGYLFNVLYKEGILEPQKDLYIYFSKDEVFITLYEDGRFLQTSVIPEGLETIYETLNESLKMRNFSFEKFMSLVVEKGLDINNYDEDGHIFFNSLSELFSNKFLIISNQIHLMLRKFELLTIDRVFMGTMKGTVPGIREFANMYLGFEANDLRFDKNYNPNNIHIDQLLFLSMLYAKISYKEDFQEDNILIFKRSPTFFYRTSGQLISVSVASLILSLLYPTYQFVAAYGLENLNQEKQEILNKLNSTKAKLTAKHKRLQNEYDNKEKYKNLMINRIAVNKAIINQLYKEKVEYIPKSLLIAKLTKYLVENQVVLDSLKYEILSLDSKSKKSKSGKKGGEGEGGITPDILEKIIDSDFRPDNNLDKNSLKSEKKREYSYITKFYKRKVDYHTLQANYYKELAEKSKEKQQKSYYEEKYQKHLELAQQFQKRYLYSIENKNTKLIKNRDVDSINYIVLKVRARKDKYITNLIETLSKKEGMFITSLGYEMKGGYYLADIIIITKVGNG